MDRITDNEMDFNSLEQWCYDMGMAFARRLMLLILRNLDDQILKTRNKSQYRSKGFRILTVKTIMGEVELPRRIYQTQNDQGGGVHICLLDQAIGLSTVGKFSMGVISRIGEVITESSYRATADAISHMTGQRMSHSGVWNVVQAVGGKLREVDQRRAQEVKALSGSGKRQIKVLQEEFDGVWIHMQGADRPKKGNREMKVSCAYEGVRCTGVDKHKKPIYELVNPAYLSGFEGAEKFYERKEGLLGSRYNMDEIEMRLHNGDGADWVAGFGEKSGEEIHRQLDPFHIQRAIKRSKLPKEIQERLRGLWEEGKIPTLLRYLHLSVDKEKQEQSLTEEPGPIETLYQYLHQHQVELIPIHKRGLNLPELEGDLLYGNMGAMETTVCGVIALRMKHHRASFTIEGASNLSRLLCFKRSGELNEAIFSLSDMTVPMPMEEILTEVLSAARTPQKEGKGYQYPINGGMPFDGVATTNGRRAVQYAAGYHW